MSVGFADFGKLNCLISSSTRVGNGSRSFCSSSSSVISSTKDASGRKQVYQESSFVKTAPGGVKQTIHSVQDSRTGLQKMAIGCHIHERGHVVEKKKNRYTGDEEENEEFINLEGDNVDRFNKEWQDKVRRFNGNKSRFCRQTKKKGSRPFATDGTSSHGRSRAARKEYLIYKYKNKRIFDRINDHSRYSPF